jgi:hypothetical protein
LASGTENESVIDPPIPRARKLSELVGVSNVFGSEYAESIGVPSDACPCEKDTTAVGDDGEQLVSA